MMPLIVESVLRSLLMAAMVWLGIRLFRVSNALAQKLAWSLVLLAAFAMPLLMRWQTAHPHAALTVPVRRIGVVSEAVSDVKQRFRAAKWDNPNAAAPLPSLSNTVVLPLVSPVVSIDRQPVHTVQWKLSTFVPYLVPAYLAVCGILLLRLLIGVALAIRLWNCAEPASPILEPRATVRISSAIQSPVNIGSGIVLPASYMEWDRAKLQLVLAHERAHVRQGDFYLQLVASFYAALVWFSPLGWYLKRTLADLGEALSDRAALAETGDHSGYAEVLLEFAAMPRQGFAHVMAGVGMARSNNLTHRIERILNDTRFRRAFEHGRRHVAIAALLIPCGLLLATALFHVQAAEVVKAHAMAVLKQAQAATLAVAPALPSTPQAELASTPAMASAVSPPPVSRAATEQVPPTPSIPPMLGDAVVPALPPLPSEALGLSGNLSALNEAHLLQPLALASGIQTSSQSIDIDSHSDGQSFNLAISDDKGALVLLEGNGKNNASPGARYNEEIARVRSQTHGSFIWVHRDGKSYVITDPALIAQARAVFGSQGEMGRRQEELGKMQGELGKQQGELAQQQAMSRIPMPDISAQMAGLQKAVDTLAAEKSQEITQARLSELQSRLGELQGRLAEAQALAASKQAGLGALQGNLGEKQAELGRKQTELGREQARIGREASQKVWSMIDQAVRDGKAKPVE
jgi:hypothetical protein